MTSVRCSYAQRSVNALRHDPLQFGSVREFAIAKRPELEDQG